MKSDDFHLDIPTLIWLLNVLSHITDLPSPLQIKLEAEYSIINLNSTLDNVSQIIQVNNDDATRTKTKDALSELNKLNSLEDILRVFGKWYYESSTILANTLLLYLQDIHNLSPRAASKVLIAMIEDEYLTQSPPAERNHVAFKTLSVKIGHGKNLQPYMVNKG